MARRGAFEHIIQDDGADVSENYTSKDDEWNRITHWTLHEFEPYKSYSYHYHNIKHPKKRFWDFWKICNDTIIWEFKTTSSIFVFRTFAMHWKMKFLIWIKSIVLQNTILMIYLFGLYQAKYKTHYGHQRHLGHWIKAL